MKLSSSVSIQCTQVCCTVLYSTREKSIIENRKTKNETSVVIKKKFCQYSAIKTEKLKPAKPPINGGISKKGFGIKKRL